MHYAVFQKRFSAQLWSTIEVRDPKISPLTKFSLSVGDHEEKFKCFFKPIIV